MSNVLEEAKRRLTDGTEMSQPEWNGLIDDVIAYKNLKKGCSMQPPPSYELIENEFRLGMNNRVVTADLIRQWAFAIGDPNPLWRDPSYAGSTRWGGIIAPPTFESAISYCTAAGKGPEASIRLPGFNNMAAGNRHDYFQLIRPGDSFRIEDRYLGIEERPVKDRPYRLFLESGQRTYINQREEVVAVATGRALITGTPPWISEDDAQVYPDRKVRHFTREELDAVYNQYDEQLAGTNRRGDTVRYWEDVAEGEEIPTVIKGPTDICDVVSGMVFMMNYSFAIKWAVMRAEKQHHPIDPRTGGYRFRRDWHFEEAFAQQLGMPYPFLDGVHVEMMCVHPLTDWMGDDAVVKSLDFQNRRINVIGDMNWLKGKVVKKYVDDGEHLVDVELSCENQDGLVSTKGVATVKLQARSE